MTKETKENRPWEIKCERKGGFRLGVSIYKTKLAYWLVFNIDIIIFTIQVSKRIKSARTK